MDTPETLKSRLYRLETHNEEDIWVEKCQGYPIFKKEESIFKLKYYSMPSRQIFYEIVVNSNIRFDKNQNGVEWIQIKEGEIMAISFKEEFSANAFWTLIDEYQRKYEVSVPAASGTHFYFEYRVPDPTENNLHDFLAEIEKIPETERHERLTSIMLTKREFLPRLCSVFKSLERAEQPDERKLELMFKIMKTIFNASNDQLLYELLCDDYFMFFLGALQYDPNFKNNRPNHRDFMRNKSKLISVVPFKNTDLFNLSIITYRLEYIRECVLLPYLNDYSFPVTSIIIKQNYKKILAHIFNPKKKDFINDLFDHLRKQEQIAFKLLREIFRIGKSIYAEDLYLQIAERDFFDIMIRCMKEWKEIQQGNVPEPLPQNKFKKKKKPEEIGECVDISMEILEQFMEYEPLHFKNYCVSESETVSKYPTITFLLEQFEMGTPITGEKIESILKILISDKENHPIKAVTHAKILGKFLEKSSLENMKKWIQLTNKIILPYNSIVAERLGELLNMLLNNLREGSKQHQIYMLEGLKNLIVTYVQSDESIEQHLQTHTQQFVDYFIWSKGSFGIRTSIYLSIFKPIRFKSFNAILIDKLASLNNPLMKIYITSLTGFMTREEVLLPNNLKRDRSEQLQDDECFQKIEKKIKID